MALQGLDPKGLRRVLKRRRKNERRARKMENAVRRNLYLDPLGRIVSGIGQAVARIFRGGT